MADGTDVKYTERDKSKYTPMMQHYLQLKEENPDAILMYRLGDFYEMFFDDAVIVSRELDLVLTGRAAGAEKAPMCGVPFHAADNYIRRLVRKGYKVAVCEQLSDPKASKGLVDRGIIRIVTPGTYMDENASRTTLNYLAVLHTNGWKAAVLLCELSTGELRYHIFDKSLSQVQKLMREQEVSELVCSRSVDKNWNHAFSQMEGLAHSVQKSIPLTIQDEALLSDPQPILKETLEVLMGYLQKTQRQHVDHLCAMEPLYPLQTMILDPETRIHLEITRSSSASAKAQSLWEFMDRCQSAMGSRMLRSWLEAPLLSRQMIEQRQQAIQILLDQFMIRDQLREHLGFVYDMERLAARMSYGSASPRDVLQLVSSLEHAAPILDLAKCLESYPDLQHVPDCHDLYQYLKNAVVPEPPLTLKEGGVIAEGFSQELDDIRKLADDGSSALLELEAREKERTGIKTLKVGYNRVFGYYIEIRSGSLSQIKDEYGYIQKQTLANASRFITQELKVLEESILQAKEKKIALEQQLFSELLEQVKSQLAKLHALSSALALVDVLSSLAELAAENGYVCPVFSEDGRIDVTEGRHPILERRLSGYVSNHWKMNPETCINLVTGPNMGGKSTWLRQNALLVIMAQSGSFVPARKAVLPIFDRIFTRIGASDDLLQGKSTFMTEMMEANTALKHATNRSLILFDEIGRGTATYDGMALAQAILEYIDGTIHARTLFSTHYHELTELEETHPSIRNVHVDVREKQGELCFEYRIIKGKADKSYGINVARLAHLPGIVLERAQELLALFENSSPGQNIQPSLFVMDEKDAQKGELFDLLCAVDPDGLSAREALECLYELKERAEKIASS